MERKIIEMLAFAKTDQAEYTPGEIYGVPAAIADRFVREKLAKYIEVSLDDDEEELAESKEKNKPSSQKPWRETVRPGDTFQWQITLNLSQFEKPRIDPKFQSEDYGDQNTDGIAEIGGDGGTKPSPEQEKAIDHLARHEPDLFEKVMKALADYPADFRPDWQARHPERAKDLVPDPMTPGHAARRVCFSSVYFSPRSRNGIAYVELNGQCAWDPEHGFTVVLHRDRVIEVCQQGSGWTDAKE